MMCKSGCWIRRRLGAASHGDNSIPCLAVAAPCHCELLHQKSCAKMHLMNQLLSPASPVLSVHMMSLPSLFAFEVASLKTHIPCAQAQWTGITLLKLLTVPDYASQNNYMQILLHFLA